MIIFSLLINLLIFVHTMLIKKHIKWKLQKMHSFCWSTNWIINYLVLFLYRLFLRFRNQTTQTVLMAWRVSQWETAATDSSSVWMNESLSWEMMFWKPGIAWCSDFTGLHAHKHSYTHKYTQHESPWSWANMHKAVQKHKHTDELVGTNRLHKSALLGGSSDRHSDRNNLI